MSELEDEFQAEVVDDLTTQRASDILETMDPDDAADILGDLPYAKAETLLRLMGVREQAQVRSLLGYKEKTAGGIMTSEVTTITPDMNVGSVIDYLRGEAAEFENIYYVYVVDEERHLLGVVSLRDLIVSSPDKPVEEIYSRDVIRVDPDDDQEDVADTMSKYDLLALPVVDEGGIILGMVTVDDALDVMEEESAEDLALATGSERFDPTGGVWKWVGRNGWVWVWAAIWIAATVVVRLAGGGDAARAAIWIALSLAFLLRFSEDIAARTVARLIDQPEAKEHPSRLVTLGLDAFGGLLLGAAVGVFVAGLAVVAAGPSALTLEVAAVAAIATALIVVVVALAGTGIGWLARRRVAAGHRVSAAAINAALMIVAALTFVATALALVRYVFRLA